MGNIVAWALVQKTPGNEHCEGNAQSAASRVLSYEDNPFVSPYGDRPVSVTNLSHYRSHPSGVECIEVIRGLPFSAGNAIKYIWRAGQKDSAKQDLDKALWYIQDCIDNKAKVLAGEQAIDMFERWANEETDLEKVWAVDSILLNELATAKIYTERLRQRLG